MANDPKKPAPPTKPPQAAPPAAQAPSGGDDAFLDWLQEDTARHNDMAERARALGYTCGGGIDAPPALNPDGSLADAGAAAAAKPAQKPPAPPKRP